MRNGHIIKQNISDVKMPDYPCRECKKGGVESNFMIYCDELKHCIVASNRTCKTGNFKKR